MDRRVVTIEELLGMDLAALKNMGGDSIARDMTREEFCHIFKLCEAMWIHDGRASSPHAELTSGKCSDGFINTPAVLQYTNLCELFSYQLMRLFLVHVVANRLGWVIGSDHAAATLSYSLAARLMCKHDFTEKGPGDTQLWRRHTIGPDEIVLQVEELVTTTATLERVRKGIIAGNTGPVKFEPFVLTLVHRSPHKTFDGVPIHYLQHFDISTWDPKDCPLCKQGSKRLRPKTNWVELTGKK